uniref:Uncharacterized protein n=1 Tax=Heterorhabditis bacteriophora TaxID=37862 RepID=A0A1I7XQR0_HETBA
MVRVWTTSEETCKAIIDIHQAPVTGNYCKNYLLYDDLIISIFSMDIGIKLFQLYYFL